MSELVRAMLHKGRYLEKTDTQMPAMSPAVALGKRSIEGEKSEMATPSVSVIILTYEPEWSKLSKTLLSVIKQESVNLEIIISDDGSENNLFPEIGKLMESHGTSFSFHLIGNKDNQGTVKNLCNALYFARGKYVKLLSPADYFYDSCTLFKWIEFIERNNCDSCFGNVNYYNSFRPVHATSPVYSRPMALHLYARQGKANRNCIRRAIIELGDWPVGASLITKKSILLKYTSILEGHVVYTEDLMLRLMAFDNIISDYYPNVVINYEYGSGISTSGDPKWLMKIRHDSAQCDILINKMRPLDQLSWLVKQRVRLFRYDRTSALRRLLKYVSSPTLIWLRIQMLIYRERITVHDGEISLDKSYYIILRNIFRMKG